MPIDQFSVSEVSADTETRPKLLFGRVSVSTETLHTKNRSIFMTKVDIFLQNIKITSEKGLQFTNIPLKNFKLFESFQINRQKINAK